MVSASVWFIQAYSSSINSLMIMMSGGDLVEGNLFLTCETGAKSPRTTMSQQIGIQSGFSNLICYIVLIQVLVKFVDVGICAAAVISGTWKNLSHLKL
jgi:hypothetical protein